MMQSTSIKTLRMICLPSVQGDRVSAECVDKDIPIWCQFWVRLVAALVVCATLSMFSSSTAYAWFNDVTDSYPASQDIPISGSILTGVDVPEGVYSITATSSSYMCKLTNVTLTSAGGGLWATFNLSAAYNALYPGTAEEAAASTNEDGTDVSAYYISDPLEGYVSRQFSIPIDALNQEMTLATYSGGSKGIDGGMWYTRTVVFNSSKEVEDAIAAAEGGQDEGGGDTPSDVPDDSGDEGGDDPSDTGGDDSQDDGSYDDGVADDGALPDDSASTDEEGTDGSEGEEKGSESESRSPAASNTPQGSTAGNTENTDNVGEEEGAGNSEEGEEPSDAAASKESAETEAGEAKGSGAKIREIKFAGNQVIEVDESDLPDQRQQEAEAKKVQNAGVVAAGVLGTLNVALVGAYVFGLKRARPKLFSDVAKKFSKLTRKS